MKIKLFIAPLLLISLIMGCTQNPIIAEMYGNIGRDDQAFYADIAFDLFRYSAEGEGESTKLSLTFDNYSGEFMTFTLSPFNPSGASFDSMFTETKYLIDGSTNQFEGSVVVGSGLQTFRGSSGSVSLSNFSVSEDNEIIICAGTFAIGIEGGGRVDGNFTYQLAAQQ